MRAQPTAPAGRRRPVRHHPRSLSEVAGHLGAAAPAPGALITGVSQDSRAVRPGDLYVALPGARHHGAAFAAEALARGAVAAVSDRAVPGLPTVVVADPRLAAGPLAAWLYDHPSHDLDVYGVTGTNGKSSTTYLLHAALSAPGRPAGLMSGIEVRGPAGGRPSGRTTPEADELQAELAALREDGARAAAVEVSSHGLALHRVDGTRFRAGVFTNLGHDHLDLHGDLEGYFAAKALLFAPDRCGLAVVNVDDPFGRRLAAQVSVPVVTYSPGGGDADYRATGVRADHRSTGFTVHGPGLHERVELRLLGAHQVDNALAAIAAAAATSVDPRAAVRAVGSLDRVPGRLERVDAGQPFLALVDYVHNTAGQDRLFPYLRSLSPGRVHVVVSITGERDPSKREPLGRNAARYADTVVVTDDSPYSEDPAQLREQIAGGARSAGGAEVVVVVDRTEAIAHAVSRARPGDIVLVAGRGHEQRLVSRDRVELFDDRAALRHAIIRAGALTTFSGRPGSAAS